MSSRVGSLIVVRDTPHDTTFSLFFFSVAFVRNTFNKRTLFYQLRGASVTNRSSDGRCWILLLSKFSAGQFPHHKGSALSAAWPVRHKQAISRQVLDLVSFFIFSAGHFPTKQIRFRRLRGASITSMF